MKKYFHYTVSMTRDERANAQKLMAQEGYKSFTAYVRWLIEEHGKREPTQVVRMTNEQYRIFQEAIKRESEYPGQSGAVDQRRLERKRRRAG